MPKKEVIFKNPARKFNKTLHKQEPYQPEHVRLGLEPGKPAKISSEDFQYALNKRKPFVTSSKGPKQEAKSLPSASFKEDLTFVRKYPPQVNVSSGVNHEHTWRPVAEYYDEETVPAEHSNEETYPWLDDKSTEDLEAQEMYLRKEPLKYDDVKIDLKSIGEVVEEDDISVEDMKYNQFCIIVRGQIICVSDTLTKIENVIKTILSDDDLDVGVEEIIVFKRLLVKTGVMVKE